MHAAFFRPGGVHQDLPQALLDDIGMVRAVPRSKLDQLEGLVTENRIFKQRNVDIGVVDLEDDHGLGLLRRDGPRFRLCLGPAPRAALRVLFELDFKIPVGKNGDNYDRYVCRMEEMRESTKIMQQCIDIMNREGPGPVLLKGKSRAAHAAPR
jgi:NADH-quinone oxidoreductase subunit D